jgi:hypothetical protein
MSTVHEYLNARGYSGPSKDNFKEHVVYFHRRAPSTTHQWIVREWVLPFQGGHLSYEVEMIFETEGELWATIKFYSVSEAELLEKLPLLEERLLASVPSMGGRPKHYR